MPKDYAKHARLMGDLLALALQTDLTRVATWMFANEGSDKNYQMIDITEGHHTLSHHQGDAEKQAKIAKINRYHMEQFAYFLERLNSIPEGDGTLLDNTMIVYGSGIGDGNATTTTTCRSSSPAAAAGGLQAAAGTCGTSKGTPLMNLYLAMLAHGRRRRRRASATAPGCCKGLSEA